MLSLPEKVQVLPAHTNKPADFNEELISTTIGEAKRRIPFLQSGEEDFIQTLLQKIPPTPNGYLAIVEKNLAGTFADIRSEESREGKEGGSTVRTHRPHELSNNKNSEKIRHID